MYANAATNGNCLSLDITRSLSQQEMAGLLRPTSHTSGGVGSGHFGGASFMNSHGSCAGESAPDQEPSETSGTSVLCALRLVGRACHLSFDVALSGCDMKPSGPGRTDSIRLDDGRLSRIVVPRMPPGTSSAPTSAASSVRAQQHSKPPQPLLTDLPRRIATGRSGSVTPSTSMVAPTRACSRYSRVTSRIVSAATSEIWAAHSGV